MAEKAIRHSKLFSSIDGVTSQAGKMTGYALSLVMLESDQAAAFTGEKPDYSKARGVAQKIPNSAWRADGRESLAGWPSQAPVM